MSSATATTTVTMSKALNLALHDTLRDDPRVLLLGEDLLDPYGGAFKVTRGLSSAYPERVLTTPVSEAGMAEISHLHERLLANLRLGMLLEVATTLGALTGAYLAGVIADQTSQASFDASGAINYSINAYIEVFDQITWGALACVGLVLMIWLYQALKFRNRALALES